MKEEWLKQGYEDFAIYGPDLLSVNQMAKEIDASRSSFYHHFGDVDMFINKLLAQHWEVSQQFVREGREQCQALIPDLYALLANFPVPLRFACQLFHHRHIPRFNYMFMETYEASAKGFILELFARHMQLDAPEKDLLNLYKTLGEAWYARLNPQDLSSQTMQRHAESIMKDLNGFMKSTLYATLKS